MFNYAFISLTPEQLAWRRTELDTAGRQAIAVPLAFLVLLCIYRSFVRRSLPSARSILDTTYVPEYGTARVTLLVLGYAAFLLWRALHNTGTDYMHLTKACGHVGATQLVVQIALAAKRSRVDFATGTHERLNSVHRLLGRVVYGLLFAHAALYLNFFARQGILAKRLGDADVRLGVLLIVSLSLLVGLALPRVRKRAYHRLFYRSHVVLSAVLIVALWFHVKYTRPYVVAMAVLWVVNGVERWVEEKTATVKCQNLGGLIRIEATAKGRVRRNVLGRHLYLKDGWLGPRTPFTIVGATNTKAGVTYELVAKHTGGPMTSRLLSCAEKGQEMVCKVEGPYGEAEFYMEDLLNSSAKSDTKVLLVAGGVGATYILPIYQALREQALKAGRDAQSVRALWIVRSVDEVLWAERYLTSGDVGSEISVHFTQTSLPESKRYRAACATGRPDLARTVQDFFSGPLKTGRGGPKFDSEAAPAATVLVCGPRSLAVSLKQAVCDCPALTGQDVRYVEEQFGFGGS